MNKQLQELTDLTIKEIRNLEIVLPEIYRDIFYSKAKDLGIKLSDIDKEAAMFYALRKIQLIQNETERSASALKENVMNAKIAITNKDNMALQFIEDNMVELETRIASLLEELYIDDLTRLYNRRWLFEKFLKDDHFKSSGHLAFVDLNHFKEVNDQFGHIIGDKVLHVIGKVLMKVPNTTAIRFAGDEFIILSEQHDEDEIHKILHTVNQNLLKTPFKHNTELFYIDFSFGVASFKAKDSFKKVLEEADTKMYNYKKSLK
ncbi:GGDEF domain-containing protein [Sulfurospirillum multivorans]|uniref:diguanylate cyclase n=2 Tax=Sulfurospirillum multivorans TaxID=66821 RepID=A0AA86ALU5_SULMK|nr:GGDEF domain-containing protein [Sulfurospirillum multivorans]AHJ13205.1 GGDEF domain-containing protein [Sulfurospirillum multivorans DSM 12446]QEH06693.1 GGDEF domain-containing protein [Sulfurospirillum multivorans]